MVAELLKQEEQQKQQVQEEEEEEGEQVTPSTCVSDLLAQYVANVDLEELVRIPQSASLSQKSRATLPLSAGVSALTPCVHQSPAETPSRPLRPLNLFGPRTLNEAAPSPLAPSSSTASASFLKKTDLLETIAERARQIERDVSAAALFTFFPLTHWRKILSICLFIHLSIDLAAYLSISLSVCRIDVVL